MNDPARLWADPRLIYTVAVIAIAFLVVSIVLLRRKGPEGRQAGVICLMMSIALHAALVLLVPYLPVAGGGSSSVVDENDTDVGVDAISFSTFETDLDPDDAAGTDDSSLVAPLPVSEMAELLDMVATPEPSASVESPEEPSREADDDMAEVVDQNPSSLSAALALDIDSELDQWLDDLPTSPEPDRSMASADRNADPKTGESETATPDPLSGAPTASSPQPTTTAPPAMVVAGLQDDFGNRVGQAKNEALIRTGGNLQTEAAVAEALKFLAESQRQDGAWDPTATGAGRERAPLGTNRGNAGSRAETAITGLALLTMIGAGNTHREGDYAENVYRGLAYLIRTQKPDGSLAGNAAVYAANYSHGMAALAMCEAAAITRDASAVESARRALAHTVRMQHPSTGGWRYTAGDPGDLSQAGWQAMVLDAGYRAGIPRDARAISGLQRFLRSVRVGSVGGLACYRPGETPSRTMTAEALATRLLIGEQVPPREIEEAERYLLQQLPGVGQDNYYYWYYATIALHQLQDEAWQAWNQALQQRLLSTQRAEGSWPTTSLWGGYGGTVYTTSMAALCLESYYRHAIRSDRVRIADSGPSPR